MWNFPFTIKTLRRVDCDFQPQPDYTEIPLEIESFYQETLRWYSSLNASWRHGLEMSTWIHCLKMLNLKTQSGNDPREDSLAINHLKTQPENEPLEHIALTATAWRHSLETNSLKTLLGNATTWTHSLEMTHLKTQPGNEPLQDTNKPFENEAWKWTA